MYLHILQVHVVTSCYIVPHEGGHSKVHAARACPLFHGRQVFSDLSVHGTRVDIVRGREVEVSEVWYGRAILFFRAFENVLEWEEGEQVWKSIPHELVFLRWYNVTGYSDNVKCPILDWESTRRGEPSVQVRSIASLIGVEMMLPKTSATRGKELWYRNRYIKL